MVMDPLVEAPDRVAETATCWLCVKMAVHIRVPVVQYIVTHNHTRCREKLALQDDLYILPVLGLVGVNEHEVELSC